MMNIENVYTHNFNAISVFYVVDLIFLYLNVFSHSIADIKEKKMKNTIVF